MDVLSLSTIYNTQNMIECDDTVDGFTGKYMKCIYTTIDINIYRP